MLLSNSNNGDEEPHPINGISTDTHRHSEDIDSSCSTPYVSAPSSPGRGGGAGSSGGYFFSAPASPMHFVFCKTQSSTESKTLGATEKLTSAGSFEFEFSSRFSPNGPAANGSMSSADELFFNGQIRPMKLSSHLQRPQILAPLIDLDGEDEEDEEGINRRCHPDYDERVVRGRDLRSKNRSLHRKARSMSPLRVGEFQWHEESNKHIDAPELLELEDNDNNKQNDTPSIDSTPCGSASSSRSSSSGRNSKKWIFLKDLLYRSKSEGRGNSREKFWNTITLSASSSSKGRKTNSPSLTPSSSRDDKDKQQQEKPKQKQQQNPKKVTGKPVNGVSKRRFSPSPHELHYTKNRAQADEMKKKTFLPYRQGLLGCLGFSSKGYGAFNGLTKTLNPVSSR